MNYYDVLIPALILVSAFVPRFLAARKLSMTEDMEAHTLAGVVFLNIVKLNFSHHYPSKYDTLLEKFSFNNVSYIIVYRRQILRDMRIVTIN